MGIDIQLEKLQTRLDTSLGPGYVIFLLPRHRFVWWWYCHAGSTWQLLTNMGPILWSVDAVTHTQLGQSFSWHLYIIMPVWNVTLSAIGNHLSSLKIQDIKHVTVWVMRTHGYVVWRLVNKPYLPTSMKTGSLHGVKLSECTYVIICFQPIITESTVWMTCTLRHMIIRYWAYLLVFCVCFNILNGIYTYCIWNNGCLGKYSIMCHI